MTKNKPNQDKPVKADVFREQELKLNVPGVDQLNQVREHLIHDPHYKTDSDLKRQRPAVAAGMPVLGKPEEIYTPLRTRIYYDDVKLHGFAQGVEIRIEERGDSKSPFKQVIKIGGNVAGKDGTFDRAEYSSPLKTGVPDLSVLDQEQKDKLKAIFGVAKVSDIELRPLVMMVSQRWRYEYHPGGDADTLVEYAHDVARGQTFTGHQWDLYQAEIEMKEGDASALAREERRLRDTFNFFQADSRSKPSPGFEVLKAQLAAPEAQEFVRRTLTPGRFQVLTLPAFKI